MEKQFEIKTLLNHASESSITVLVDGENVVVKFKKGVAAVDESVAKELLKLPKNFAVVAQEAPIPAPAPAATPAPAPDTTPDEPQQPDQVQPLQDNTNDEKTPAGTGRPAPRNRTSQPRPNNNAAKG